jgi:hypothetical protein
MKEHEFMRSIISDDMPDIGQVRDRCVSQSMQTEANAKPSRTRPVRRLAIIAATLVLVTTVTAFAVSAELREAVFRIGHVSTDGRGVTTVVEPHHISDNLRTYVEMHIGTSGGYEQVGEDIYVPGDFYRKHWIGFASHDEAGEFFGTRFIISPLLSEANIRDLGTLYEEMDIVVDSLSGGVRNVVANVLYLNETLNSYPGDVITNDIRSSTAIRAMAIIGATYIIDDEGTIVTVNANLNLSDQMQKIEGLSTIYQSTSEVTNRDIDYSDYTSPVNGVVAIIGVYTDEEGRAFAKYTLDDVVYTVYCATQSTAQAVEILKALIDSLV